MIRHVNEIKSVAANAMIVNSPLHAGFNHYFIEYRSDYFSSNGFHYISMLFGCLITFSLQFDRFIR